jgi:hypothetical protein
MIRQSVSMLRLKMVIFLQLLLFFGAVYITESGAEDKIPICFYSSETNINNFKSLKMEFDSYLAKFGAYEFQPFDNRETFEKHIKDQKKVVVIVSGWHYSKIHNQYSLMPLLVGVLNGKNSQKRILLSGEKTPDTDAAMKGTIASSSNIEYTKAIIREMLVKKEAADSLRILTVPKDVDALMSVGFDMAKAALTTEAAFNTLKTLDPILYKKLKILSEGKESLLPILAAPKDFAPEAEKIVNILKNMSNDSAGMNIIKMLDLDGFKPFDPSSDNSKLEG